MDNINLQFQYYSGQAPAGGIKKRVCSGVVFGTLLFAFHNTPEGFCYVQMERIRWNVNTWRTVIHKGHIFPYRHGTHRRKRD